MPLRDFRCENCGKVKEFSLRMNDSDPEICEEMLTLLPDPDPVLCGGKLVRWFQGQGSPVVQYHPGFWQNR
jgi:hypothetical protein